MGQKIRWGLLGAGLLLDRWMKGAALADDDMEIAAVASRTRETAERQAAKFGIKDACVYDEILQRADIDVMYIPVPHTAHKELAVRAMKAGYNVLVEKPAAVTASDWQEMVSCAKENNVFLMEAVWTRCFPVSLRLKELLSEGVIGEVRHLEASFAYRVPDDYKGRLTDPDLAGGALLDVGVYPLHFAHMVYGTVPERMQSLASINTDGCPVDEQGVYIGQYKNGAMCTLTSAIRTDMPDTAWIYGTDGYIRIPGFWRPQSMEIVKDGKTETISLPVTQREGLPQDEGYQYEIRHVDECIRKGLKESPLVPLSATTDVLQQCDALRRQWGFRYPFENEAQ